MLNLGGAKPQFQLAFPAQDKSLRNVLDDKNQPRSTTPWYVQELTLPTLSAPPSYTNAYADRCKG